MKITDFIFLITYNLVDNFVFLFFNGQRWCKYFKVFDKRAKTIRFVSRGWRESSYQRRIRVINLWMQ